MVSCTSRGQVSFEYLVILGVALFLLIPIIGLFFSSTIESQNLNKANLLILSGRSIATSAEDVYYQGEGSKVKVELNLPEGTTLEAYNNDSVTELILKTDFDEIQTDFVFFVNTNLTFSDQTDRCLDTSLNGTVLGALGIKKLFVESCGDYVVVYSYEE